MSPPLIPSLGRALAIGPHPDDVEFGCFGALQSFEHIDLLILSSGHAGAPSETRWAEAAESARFLGANIVTAELSDTAIPMAPAIDAIRTALDAALPDVVFVPSPNDLHQDHLTTSRAGLVATRDVPTMVLGYATPSSTPAFTPTSMWEIESRQFSRKLDALALHASQAKRFYLAPQAIEASAKHWAARAGMPGQLCEPFEVLRWVRSVTG